MTVQFYSVSYLNHFLVIRVHELPEWWFQPSCPGKINMFNTPSFSLNDLHFCHILTIYLIKYSLNEPPPHTSEWQSAVMALCSATGPASTTHTHTHSVFRAAPRPLGGGQLSSRAVSAQASCCAEGRQAQPHKSLHYGSSTRAPAPLWLSHKGLHSGS